MKMAFMNSSLGGEGGGGVGSGSSTREKKNNCGIFIKSQIFSISWRKNFVIVVAKVAIEYRFIDIDVYFLQSKKYHQMTYKKIEIKHTSLFFSYLVSSSI
jgi:hypothetical protein